MNKPCTISDEHMKRRRCTFSTISYIGLWEKINNPDFKPHIYEGFRTQSAEPSFWMSLQKWIKETNAIVMISKSGRYGRAVQYGEH